MRRSVVSSARSRSFLVPAFVGFVAIALALAACGGGGGKTTVLAPVITSVTPSSGGTAGGTDVTIEGTGLANTGPGVSEVRFGDVLATQVIVHDATRITTKVPPGVLGTVDVSVTKNHGTGLAPAAFTYHPAPTLTMVDPDTGSRLGGQIVRLTGSGFLNNDPGPIKIFFGPYLVQLFLVLSDTEIDVTTPVAFAEETVNVSVENNNGKATLSVAFRYGGPPPTITSIFPTEGFTIGGTLVTITGTDFVLGPPGTNQVFIGSSTGMNVVRVDENTLTFVTPPHPPGTFDVTVINPNGQDTLADAFTYEVIPTPTVTAITPGEGPVQGGTTVTMTGTNFQAVGAGTTVVTVGGNAALNVQVLSDTSISFDTPAGAAGLADVAMSNANGTANTLTNAFFYFALYVADGTFGTSGSLYVVDATTGQSTAVGSLGRPVTGMAFHPTTGVLYGVGNNQLFTIDTTNAQTTSIGSLSDTVADITFIGTTLVGYGQSTGPSTIDLTNASMTSLGASGGWPCGSGFAANAAGTSAYFVEACGGRFYSVNTSTGAATLVGGISPWINAMTFHNGTMYGVGNEFGSTTLYTVTTTGGTSSIGGLPGNIDAIASNKP